MARRSTNVDISGSSEHSINAHEVNNLVLQNSTITPSGQVTLKDGLHAYNLKGASTAITNTSISGAGGSAVRIENNTNLTGSFGSSGTITVTGSTFTSSTSDDGFAIATRGTNATTLSITGSTITSNPNGDGVIAVGYGGSTLNVTVGTSTVTGNAYGIAIVGDGTTANVDFNVSGNTSIGLNALDDVRIEKSRNSGTSTMEGYVQNNSDLDTEAGRAVPAISLFNAGGGTLTAVVRNNTIDYAGSDFGIRLDTGDNGAGQLNATVQGNTVRLAGSPWTRSSIRSARYLVIPGDHPSGDNSVLFADLGGTGALANTVQYSGTPAVSFDVRLRQRYLATVELPGCNRVIPPAPPMSPASLLVATRC